MGPLQILSVRTSTAVFTYPHHSIHKEHEQSRTLLIQIAMSSGRVHPPFSLARSTGGESQSLLCALLAAGKLDEISNAENYAAVERYVKSAGQADEAGKTTIGVAFWLYPTGLHGPYHVEDGGVVQQHGILITAEPGVMVGDVVQKARAVSMEGNELVHEHVATA